MLSGRGACHTFNLLLVQLTSYKSGALNLGDTSAASRPHPGRIPAASLLHPGCIPAASRPKVHITSTSGKSARTHHRLSGNLGTRRHPLIVDFVAEDADNSAAGLDSGF